jgi:hypothetical protein
VYEANPNRVSRATDSNSFFLPTNGDEKVEFVYPFFVELLLRGVAVDGDLEELHLYNDRIPSCSRYSDELTNANSALQK